MTISLENAWKTLLLKRTRLPSIDSFHILGINSWVKSFAACVFFLFFCGFWQNSWHYRWIFSRVTCLFLLFGNDVYCSCTISCWNCSGQRRSKSYRMKYIFNIPLLRCSCGRDCRTSSSAYSWHQLSYKTFYYPIRGHNIMQSQNETHNLNFESK